MMSSYTLVIGVIIYFINYDKINVLFKNKKNQKNLMVFPFVLAFISLACLLVHDLNDNEPIIPSKGGQVYEESKDFLDLSEIDKDLVYKYNEEEDKVLKKEDGAVKQFKPVTEAGLKKCQYSIYILDDGYILSCNQNYSSNYYTKDLDTFFP